MPKLHLTNADGRNTTVQFSGVPAKPGPQLGLPGEDVDFRRYLAAVNGNDHEDLVTAHGEDYGQALIDGDPEVDIEQVGRRIGATDVVYLSAEGVVLHAAPELIELIFDAQGEETERRAPKDVPANVNETEPVHWTPMKMKRSAAARRFAFRRSLQLRHVDGLTYDYLFTMAKELDEQDEVVLIGAGAKGKDPLIFQHNGSPYRAFLEGRVDGERYQLLLHLSNMELKRPEEVQP